MAREKTIMEMRDILSRLKLGHGIKQIFRDTGSKRQIPPVHALPSAAVRL